MPRFTRMTIPPIKLSKDHLLRKMDNLLPGASN
jgi:hypothetical protein